MQHTSCSVRHTRAHTRSIPTRHDLARPAQMRQSAQPHTCARTPESTTHTQRHDAHTRTASRADSGGQCELHSTGGTSRAIIFIDTAASVPEPRPSPVRILTTYAATAGAAKADPRRAELIAAGSARTSGLGDSAVHAIGGGARIIAAGGRKGEGDWEDSPSAESSSRSTASSPRCDGGGGIAGGDLRRQLDGFGHQRVMQAARAADRSEMGEARARVGWLGGRRESVPYRCADSCKPTTCAV